MKGTSTSQSQLLAKYNYKKDKPHISIGNYTVYKATNIQSNQPVTIRILRQPYLQLGSYLTKLKAAKSQNVIRIFQLVTERSVVIMVTEQVCFGNVRQALARCRRLDQSDGIFMAKQILHGHADLLRAGVNWLGTEEDIEFTDGGIKLSWNNGCGDFGNNLVSNPFPLILRRLVSREFDDSGRGVVVDRVKVVNLVSPQQKQSSSMMQPATTNSTILPFPPSKQLQQLIRISKENASQISMNPLMKKKDKLSRKKGKGWMSMKQYKNKNQYFEQLTYFAVSKEYGFIRVKAYEAGQISPNLLQLNKKGKIGGQGAFTRIYAIEDEMDGSGDSNININKSKVSTTSILNHKPSQSKISQNSIVGPPITHKNNNSNLNGKQNTLLICQYMNDGNLQSYILRLKNANIKLKQEQIEFFIYSLFDPIRKVQESTLKSINMLHIKNIYLENGIPKIGEPIPTNPKLFQVLKDRCDVPDFYHPGFKNQPLDRHPKYDTYSIGVLLYKLMYTEYPIFPNGKVHIPTTPVYNKRLKDALEIFLNEGGTLKDIEERIDVSQTVKKQVRDNKEVLLRDLQAAKAASRVRIEGKGRRNKKDREDGEASTVKEVDQDDDDSDSDSDSESDDASNAQGGSPDDDNTDNIDDGPNYYAQFLAKIQLPQPQRYQNHQRKPFIDQLEHSVFKGFRIWTKIVFAFILYTFLFYYHFLYNTSMLYVTQSLLTAVQLHNLPDEFGNIYNYKIVTSDIHEFERAYNHTSLNLGVNVNMTVMNVRGDQMNCAVDKQELLSASGSGSSASPSSTTMLTSSIKHQSGSYLGYITGGLLVFLLILLLKGLQLHFNDQINAYYRKQNGNGHFNLLNWLVFNLTWLSLLSGQYFTFNFMFESQTEPCVGYKNGHEWGSTYALFHSEVALFVIFMIIQLIVGYAFLAVLRKNSNLTPKYYNYLINPVSLFGIALVFVWLIIRLGVTSNVYYPSAFNDSARTIPKMLSQGNYVLLFAILPQFLFVFELTGYAIINWVYLKYVDIRQGMDQSKGQDQKLLAVEARADQTYEQLNIRKGSQQLNLEQYGGTMAMVCQIKSQNQTSKKASKKIIQEQVVQL